MANSEVMCLRPGWGGPTPAMIELLKKDRAMSPGVPEYKLPLAEVETTDSNSGVFKVRNDPDTVLSKLCPADQKIYHSLATEEQKRVYFERQQTYGSCTLSHTCIGGAWTAYLNNFYGTELPPMPAHVVAHLLTIFKIMRAAKVYHADNYVDGHNYFQFADCFQQAGE